MATPTNLISGDMPSLTVYTHREGESASLHVHDVTSVQLQRGTDHYTRTEFCSEFYTRDLVINYTDHVGEERTMRVCLFSDEKSALKTTPRKRR